jgi:hypothetical protein
MLSLNLLRWLERKKLGTLFMDRAGARARSEVIVMEGGGGPLLLIRSRAQGKQETRASFMC